MERTRYRPTGYTLARAVMKFIGALLPLAALVALVGCGGTMAQTNVSSPVPTSATPSATPVPASTPDMAAARTAALAIFFALPGQAPEVWVPCTTGGNANNFAACPFTAAIKARLNYLSSTGFGSDVPPGCGEDYITGTQNGLNTAPQILSAVADANGSVIVIIQRGPQPPNFTVTMTLENGLWLASDLASGTGPTASVFSAKPNC
jgi:hypothetical protein